MSMGRHVSVRQAQLKSRGMKMETRSVFPHMIIKLHVLRSHCAFVETHTHTHPTVKCLINFLTDKVEGPAFSVCITGHVFKSFFLIVIK